MNYYEKHIGDFIKDTIGLSMMEDGAYNRLLDQLYQTERPLPADKKELYRMSRANLPAERKAVDYVLAKYFELQADGYMQKRAQEAIEEYWDKEPAAQEKRENAKERKRRSRERRAGLFEELRGHGVTPAFNAKTKELEDELSRILSRVTDGDSHDPVTSDGTATQSPVPKHQTPVLKPLAHRATDQPELARGAEGSETPSSEAEKPEVTPTAAALLSQAMRKHGVMSQPGDPRLIALATQGVSVETVEAACQEAKQSKPNERISPAYIAAIVQRWSTEAKAIDATGAKPPEQRAGNPPKEIDRWWTSESGIQRRAKELGVRILPSHKWDDVKAMCFDKERKQKDQAKTREGAPA
jgi:uncharacterized protein YdaU (DUF1376 family)